MPMRIIMQREIRIIYISHFLLGFDKEGSTTQVHEIVVETLRCIQSAILKLQNGKLLCMN